MLGACATGPGGSTASPTSASPAAPTATAGVATQAPAPTAAPSAVSIKDLDICALISADEIASAAGFDVGDGERLELQSETAACQWNGTEPSAIQFATIAVFPFRPGAWFPPEPEEPDGEIVTGVGDEAYRKEIGLSDTAGDLSVRSGDLIIVITLFNDLVDYEELHPIQEEFAKLLISRL
jgi:hypothetical protein